MADPTVARAAKEVAAKEAAAKAEEARKLVPKNAPKWVKQCHKSPIVLLEMVYSTYSFW